MAKNSGEPTQMETFHVTLRFEERMVLSMLLVHAEASAAALGIVRRFREKLSPSEEEAKALGVFTTPDGRTGWETDADKPVEFNVGPSLKAIIAALLRRADATNGLTLAHVSLYEQFVGELPASEELDALSEEASSD